MESLGKDYILGAFTRLLDGCQFYVCTHVKYLLKIITEIATVTRAAHAMRMIFMFVVQNNCTFSMESFSQSIVIKCSYKGWGKEVAE